MENLMLLWDEIDDWASACRHVAGSAMAEMVSSTPTSFAPISSALTVWLLLLLS